MKAWTSIVVALVLSIFPVAARADATARMGWSARSAGLFEKVQRTGTLVVQVVVPLCHNAQIDCASTRAGDPDDLEQNLYWGAVFGMRKFFDRKASPYQRIAVDRGEEGDLLERAVYRRDVPGAAWGRAAPVELLVVFEAIHGDRIDDAVDRFWAIATRGSEVRFEHDGRARTVAIDVAGYAGHNRMLDGKALPSSPNDAGKGVPSFVLACYSQSTFHDALVDAGSAPLLLTSSLIAPEAYVVTGLLEALGADRPVPEVRHAAVAQYAAWHDIDYRVASGLFAPVDDRADP